MAPRLSRAGGEALCSESSSGEDFWDYSSSYSDGNHLQQHHQSVRKVVWRKRRGSLLGLRKKRDSPEEHSRSRSYTTGDIQEQLRPSSPPPPLLQSSSSTLDDTLRSRTESSESECDAIFVTTQSSLQSNTLDAYLRILARRASVVARHRSQQVLLFVFYTLLDMVFFLLSTAFSLLEVMAIFVRNNMLLRYMGCGLVCVAAHAVRFCGLSPAAKPEPIPKSSTTPTTTLERSPRWRLRRTVQTDEAKRRKLLRLRRERVDCFD